MCQTKSVIKSMPLGGISICSLDELYSADRDVVAKLVGYLALSRAYNLVNSTLALIAQVDDVEMIVTCQAAFECAYMDFAQKATSSPTFARLNALYQAARRGGLYASIPLMSEVYQAALDVAGFSPKDNQYVAALNEMLPDLMALTRALEDQISDLQTSWAAVERMVSHLDDLVCVSNCNQFLMQCDMVAAQDRACSGSCGDECSCGHSQLSLDRMATAAGAI